MQRTLSSPLTFFWKFIATPLLIGGFVCALASGWIGHWLRREGTPLSVNEVLMALLLVSLVGAQGFRMTAALKRVAVDDHTLYISNYLTEIRVPLSDVLDVKESSRRGSLLIRLHLRRPTAFGQSIVFRPRLRLYWWGLHPVARELKTLVEQARARQAAEASVAGRKFFKAPA
jgi:hypothetical protein